MDGGIGSGFMTGGVLPDSLSVSKLMFIGDVTNARYWSKKTVYFVT